MRRNIGRAPARCAPAGAHHVSLSRPQRAITAARARRLSAYSAPLVPPYACASAVRALRAPDRCRKMTKLGGMFMRRSCSRSLARCCAALALSAGAGRNSPAAALRRRRHHARTGQEGDRGGAEAEAEEERLADGDRHGRQRRQPRDASAGWTTPSSPRSRSRSRRQGAHRADLPRPTKVLEDGARRRRRRTAICWRSTDVIAARRRHSDHASTARSSARSACQRRHRRAGRAGLQGRRRRVK